MDILVDKIADKQCVLIGEASHGTKEYYNWRAEISRRLIEEKNFSFIAVEGDWPDCYEINRYVKGYPDSGQNAREVLWKFKRWPTWMWANEEVREFVEWLREYNESAEEHKRVGFYGLDVYSLYESLDVIVDYVRKNDPKNVEKAYRAYRCFEPYGKDVYKYATASAFVDKSCADEVIRLLSHLKTNIQKYNDPEEMIFNVEQNAHVLKNAETYYRIMLRADALSWNVRDEHMMETLERLVDYQGNGKAIIWAHNTHVGDARATSMAEEGMVNIGQLARERYGDDNVALVGFGSYEGSVIAARSWGAPMKKMRVPEARKDSWEYIFHEMEGDGILIISDMLRGFENERRGQRAIGVVYHPEAEAGNYVPTDLMNRYDAFIYIDWSEALSPLPIGFFKPEIPETFPFGE